MINVISAYTVASKMQVVVASPVNRVYMPSRDRSVCRTVRLFRPTIPSMTSFIFIILQTAFFCIPRLQICKHEKKIFSFLFESVYVLNELWFFIWWIGTYVRGYVSDSKVGIWLSPKRWYCLFSSHKPRRRIFAYCDYWSFTFIGSVYAIHVPIGETQQSIRTIVANC